MSASFVYQWDAHRCQWQIVSRSGHIVFHSSSEEHIRRVCERLCAVHAEQDRPISVKRRAAASGVRGPSATKLPRGSIRWPFKIFAAGLVIGISCGSAAGQCPATPGWQVEYRQQHRQVARPVWETSYQQQSQKVLRTVWATEQRDETYTVTRPVVETSLRHEKVLAAQPVTTFRTQYVDQGAWVEQTVYRPAPASTQLRWVPGGWTTDARTGLTFWLPGMFRPAKVESPGMMQSQRVWRPNVVATQVPQTTYVSRVDTRAVPAQSVRYVQEQRVRKVPVSVQRVVEQEEVRQVPVTTCRMVYEDRVERVPVLVHRGSACPTPAGPATTTSPSDRPAEPAPEQPTPRPAAESSNERPPLDPQPASPPSSERSSTPLLKSYDVDRVAAQR